MYDPELDLANEVAEEVRGYFDDTVFHTLIPRDVRISDEMPYVPSFKEAATSRSFTQDVLFND